MRVVIVLLFMALGVTHAAACGRFNVTGYSKYFGAMCGSPTYQDQTHARKTYGLITKINVYTQDGCVAGVKPTYGYDSRNSRIIGRAVGAEADLKLSANEVVTMAEVRAGSRCIEFLQLYTSKGRTLQAGKPSSQAALQTATINRNAGYLAALRGHDYTQGSTMPAACLSALSQLQFVWGVDDCAPAPPTAPTPSATNKPSRAPEQGSTSPGAIPVAITGSPSPSANPTTKTSPSPSPKATTQSPSTSSTSKASPPLPATKPSPMPSPKPSPTPTPTPSPKPTPTPSPTPSPKPTPKPIPTPSPPPPEEACTDTLPLPFYFGPSAGMACVRDSPDCNPATTTNGCAGTVQTWGLLAIAYKAIDGLPCVDLGACPAFPSINLPSATLPPPPSLLPTLAPLPSLLPSLPALKLPPLLPSLLSPAVGGGLGASLPSLRTSTDGTSLDGQADFSALLSAGSVQDAEASDVADLRSSHSHTGAQLPGAPAGTARCHWALCKPHLKVELPTLPDLTLGLPSPPGHALGHSSDNPFGLPTVQLPSPLPPLQLPSLADALKPAWAKWGDFISFGLGKPFARPPALPEGLQQLVCLFKYATSWSGRPTECRTGMLQALDLPSMLP